jgi:hypothetical protein
MYFLMFAEFSDFSDFFADFFRGDVFRTLAEFLPMPSFSVLIHTCKRELSPAHLVCPWRHNA